MGVYSKELEELDRNTVRYMIDEMQTQLNQKDEQLNQKDEQLNQKNEQLQEKDLYIRQLQKELEDYKNRGKKENAE